jgi:hypothetical protein
LQACLGKIDAAHINAAADKPQKRDEEGRRHRQDVAGLIAQQAGEKALLPVWFPCHAIAHIALPWSHIPNGTQRRSSAARTHCELS